MKLLPRLLTPEQRQTVLYILKKGPQFGDRDLLAGFAIDVAAKVTGKDITKFYKEHMKQWRKREANGPIPNNHTFLY